MKTKTIKNLLPNDYKERLEQVDCPYCDKKRQEGVNYCGRCGKQLKETPIILNYNFQGKLNHL